MPALPICERLVLVMMDALEGIASFPALYVYRNMDAPHAQFPALVLYDGDIVPDYSTSGHTRFEMTLTVEGVVQAADGSDLGAQLNRLYADVVKAALADLTLGGLAYDLEVGSRSTNIGKGEGQGPIAGFSLPFVVKYVTLEDDPYTLAPI